MRRIAIALMTTISGLVLLFSYHTSRGPETVTVAEGQDDGATDDGGTADDETADDETDDGATADGGSTDDGTTATDDGQASPTADAASSTPRASSSPSPTSGRKSPTTRAGAVSGTFTGSRVGTQWGPVRVRIVVRNGKITKATAIEYPNENHRDQEINSWAIPQLQEATVQAQSARIDSLGGATVTSQGYIRSLQSALDKAHL